MYKIVFCGTPFFAIPSLVKIHQDNDFEIKMVLTQPDRPSGRGQKLVASDIKNKALELGLQVRTPEKLSLSEEMQIIKKSKYDLAIVVAYGQILSQEFIDSFKYGCVNIHSSLLPRWRGAAPMQRALMAGDLETGVSLQKIVKKLDAGDIIGERKIPLPIDMGAWQLYEKLSHLGAELLTHELKSYLDDELSPVAQDESLITYAHKILKEEADINWSLKAFEIHNKIRGLDMGGPYAATSFAGKTLKIHKSLYVELYTNEKPGTVTQINKNSFLVACGKNQIEVFEVQPESKARMKSEDFIRGYRLKKGDQLG
jgi:methionyl-tRNA formyltransferase